jgi:hypothetical protein
MGKLNLYRPLSLAAKKSGQKETAVKTTLGGKLSLAH